MKVIVDYDPLSGNINTPAGMYFVGSGLSLPEAGSAEQAQKSVSDVVALSNNGMTAQDLISMRKAGVI